MPLLVQNYCKQESVTSCNKNTAVHVLQNRKETKQVTSDWYVKVKLDKNLAWDLSTFEKIREKFEYRICEMIEVLFKDTRERHEKLLNCFCVNRICHQYSTTTCLVTLPTYLQFIFT